MEAGPPSDNLYFADLPAGFDQEAVTRVFSAYGQIVQSKILPTTAPGGKVSGLIRFASVDEAKWICENLNGNIPQGLTEPIVVRYATQAPGKGFGKGGAQAAAGLRASPYGAMAAFNPAAGLFNPAAAAAAAAAGFFNPAAMAGFPMAADKGLGKGKVSVKVLYNGLLAAGALPGNASYDGDTENTLYVAGLPADTEDLDLYKIFSPFGAIAPRGVRAMTLPDGSCRGFGFVNFNDTTASLMASQILNGTTMPDGTVLQVKPKGPGKTDGMM